MELNQSKGFSPALVGDYVCIYRSFGNLWGMYLNGKADWLRTIETVSLGLLAFIPARNAVKVHTSSLDYVSLSLASTLSASIVFYAACLNRGKMVAAAL